jgi:spermidine synthase
LRDVNETFDVVIIDFPDPRSVELAKLYSVSFYRQLATRLTPAAIVSIQSTSPRDAPLVFHSIGQTLSAAGLSRLPYHTMVPSFGDWGWHLAWNHAEPESSMRARLEEAGDPIVPTRFLTGELIRSSLAFGKDIAEPGVAVLENTRWRPVLVDYHKRSYR